MKNDLTCALVRDLLPPYIEGLTEEETSRAVERHLGDCPACRARRDQMRADAEAPQAEEKELDYLKTVKKKGNHRVIKAVALTVAVVVLGVLLKLFVIGEPASAAGMSWSIQTDGNALNVRAFSTWSGIAYCRWETAQEGDTVYIRTQKVLPSYLYPTADNRMRIPTEGVKHVYLAERLIWSEGEVISSRVADLLAHKAEYVGDASAVGALCQALNVSELGESTMELRTSAQPYRLTRIFTSGDPGTIHDAMSINAMYLLALVDNLEEVAWEAPDGSVGMWDVESLDRYLQNFLVEEYETVYNEDLDFPESIKDCAAPANLAKLEKLRSYLETYRR